MSIESHCEASIGAHACVSAHRARVHPSAHQTGVEKEKAQVAQAFCESLMGDYPLNGKFKEAGVNHSSFL